MVSDTHVWRANALPLIHHWHGVPGWIQSLKHQSHTLPREKPIVELLQALEQDPEGSKMDRPPEEVLRDTLRLLGNAVHQTSWMWRKRVLNPDIQDLADNEEIFKEAAPNLFGENFEKKMKVAVKILSKSQSQSGTSSRSFFQNSHPSQAQRGGGSFRTARGRFSPMGSPQIYAQSWCQKVPKEAEELKPTKKCQRLLSYSQRICTIFWK